MESIGCGQRSGSTFFSNTECAYFPCHKGVDEREFNCLFCYCPLYVLGPRCGGDYRYTKAGTKDCTLCTRLHEGDAGATLVKERFAELAVLAREDVGPVRGDAQDAGGDGRQ